MRLEANIYGHKHVYGGDNNVTVGELIKMFAFSSNKPIYDAIKIANLEITSSVVINQERPAIALSAFPQLLEGICKLENNSGNPRYKWVEDIRKSEKTITVSIPKKKTVIIYQAD